MIRLITVTLLFSVLCAAGSYVPHNYYIVNESKNWTNAQKYCRENYVDLATISNMDEMNELINILKNKSMNQTWIGLQGKKDKKWRWSLADETFSPNGNLYTNWHPGQPNENSGEICVTMWSGNGMWNDATCYHLHPFMCYDKNTSTSGLILIDVNMTWGDAQRYCRANHIDLVSVRNQTENNQIWEKIKNVRGNFIWIGLFNDSWEWSDQSNSSFRYWKADHAVNSGENEKCAQVLKSGNPEQYYWDDTNCKDNLPFICHENKLILIQQKQTWREALKYCRDNHNDLASIQSEKIQRWVENVVQKASTEHVWLGLRHAQIFWFWVEGEFLRYENWAPGKGTGAKQCSTEERSGAVESGGEHKWISLPESQELNFICST